MPQNFFSYVLNIPYELERIPYPKQARRLPTCYTYSEVIKIINSAANVKHYTMLLLVYSSGLRVSEVVSLTLNDIVRDKMLLRVNQGKGRKDRYTTLSHVALKALEAYWKQYRPGNWIFPGSGGKGQLSIRAVQHAYQIAKTNAGITKSGGIHTLRHSFATHFLEVGGGLFQLQKFMGHKSIRTTLRYVHLCEEKTIARSPLDVYYEADGQ